MTGEEIFWLNFAMTFPLFHERQDFLDRITISGENLP